jgi:para-nitrobenzyl esterase
MRRALRTPSVAAWSLGLCAALTSLTLRAGAGDDGPVARIASGQVRGAVLSKGGAVFKGIPYAQPPVRALRWREPAPVQNWSGVRDATAFGPPCAQNAGLRVLEASREDCLFLNVWTPEWPATSRRPVMFWIHGGGNYAGATSNPTFDGESLSRHGVLFVSAAYRLTVFGFFAHPELTRESPRRASGNYGLMDQIAALKWVHDNIAAFGGDPSNVTIFGQSAGAVDANVLMASPSTRGLFQRVIAESGTVTRVPDDETMRMTALGAVMSARGGDTYSDALTLAEAEQYGRTFVASFNGPETLAALRDLPASELLKAAAAPRMSIGPANGVIVDGWVLPKSPAEAFASGQAHRVPLLLGNNARERTPPQTSPEELSSAVKAMYGPLAPRAASMYGFTAGGTPPPDVLYGGTAAQWVVDTMYRCPVVAQLIWHADRGNAAYEYQFDRAAPGREAAGAVHGAEVPYVFGSLGAQYGVTDRDISAAMQVYWTNFARTGNPNGAGRSTLPRWPAFQSKAKGYLEFTDGGPVAREGLRQPFCDLYVENMKRLIAQ